MKQILEISRQLFGGAMNHLLEPAAYESTSRISIWSCTRNSVQRVISSPPILLLRNRLPMKHRFVTQLRSPSARKGYFVTSAILLLLTIRLVSVLTFRSNSTSFNLTGHFSPSTSSSAQNFETYCYICETI